MLRQFADACNKHGMGICYYLHPMCDHYSTLVANVTAEQFSQRQLGKIREALTQYGPSSTMISGRFQDSSPNSAKLE